MSSLTLIPPAQRHQGNPDSRISKPMNHGKPVTDLELLLVDIVTFGVIAGLTYLLLLIAFQ